MSSAALRCFVVALALAVPVQAQDLASADALWERRSDGARGFAAAPGPVAAAVAAYEAALRTDPTSLEAAWKLMRALWYQGDFVGGDEDAKQAVFARGREVGERAFVLLEKRAGPALRGKKLADLEPASAAQVLRGVPEAAPVYFWAAVNWGLWGESFGKLAAARQGVAGRIRDYSQVVALLDERYEEAGGRRVLGRLHAEAPKIPLVTGWVDRGAAFRELKRALELAPESRYARVWLAEAILDHAPARRADAKPLLEWVAASTPRPEHLVEDRRLVDEARRLLATWR